MTKRRFYFHYSALPILEVLDAEQADHPRSKPCGLWFSVETEHGRDWPKMCRSLGYVDERLKFRQEIVLASAARVLRLESHEAVVEFTHRYQAPGKREDYHSIRWREVAADYDGIVFSPYLEEPRFDPRTLWYWMLDVASGCVWRASAASVFVTARNERDESCQKKMKI